MACTFATESVSAARKRICEYRKRIRYKRGRKPVKEERAFRYGKWFRLIVIKGAGGRCCPKSGSGLSDRHAVASQKNADNGAWRGIKTDRQGGFLHPACEFRITLFRLHLPPVAAHPFPPLPFPVPTGLLSSPRYAGGVSRTLRCVRCGCRQVPRACASRRN